jgi:hypothetical protein
MLATRAVADAFPSLIAKARDAGFYFGLRHARWKSQTRGMMFAPFSLAKFP